MTRTSSETGSTTNDTSGPLFDVFLSFRGLDTRLNITDTLYYALLDEGIHVCIDKKGIDVGDEIGPEIYQAIDDSKVCIPIFSTGYASSRRCLCELEHMMKRRRTHGPEVMPIFYDVEPSVVKLETGAYRDAVTQHKRERGDETVQDWEEALKEVTKIKGWDTKNTGYVNSSTPSSIFSLFLLLEY
ncbi:disease resistance protein L6-like isoform X2 [Syzygium oleosum]|nr:disease resistance protein L6-like isoform X2 [Syzygium oleosum]XP_056174744.1 disease resistance protein L6-like isoform X2 [Syzygium oleosum]XP_056174745.1 disease resistance protein L6-like isoform X2 [Syzygium oleosum]